MASFSACSRHTMTPSTSAKGYLLALSATVLWSTTFPLARLIAFSMSPVELAFWRWLFTFSCMLPFGFVAVKNNRPALKKNWKWILAAGVLGFSMYSILMFEAGRTTDATNMSLIAATAPVFMAFFAIAFLHERLSFPQILGLVIAVIGVLVLVLKGEFTGFPICPLPLATSGCCWLPRFSPFTAFWSEKDRGRCRKKR